MLAQLSDAPINLKETCQHALKVMLGACVLTIASQVALMVPYSCVPFTLQAQAVLALSVLLGPKHALQSVLIYLAMGACGLPVFAHGCGTLMHLVGPRGGYLMSYLLVAPFVGRLSFTAHQFWHFLGVLLLGNALVMACGCLWLAAWVGLPAAFMTGVVPFLLSDFAKTLLVALGIYWRTYWQKKELTL